MCADIIFIETKNKIMLESTPACISPIDHSYLQAYFCGVSEIVTWSITVLLCRSEKCKYTTLLAFTRVIR